MIFILIFFLDGETFFAIQDFVDHLEQKHTNGTYTCHTCGVTLPAKNAKKHLLCHKIGSFACIFCNFGTNSDQMMRNHMSNKHSTKLLYACGRYSRKDVVVSFFLLLKHVLVIFRRQLQRRQLQLELKALEKFSKLHEHEPYATN